MQVLGASKIFDLTASTEGSWFLSWNVTVPRLQAWTGLGTLGSRTDIFAEDCNLVWARSPSWTCEWFQKLGIVELRWHRGESDAAESCQMIACKSLAFATALFFFLYRAPSLFVCEGLPSSRVPRWFWSLLWEQFNVHHHHAVSEMPAVDTY